MISPGTKRLLGAVIAVVALTACSSSSTSGGASSTTAPGGTSTTSPLSADLLEAACGGTLRVEDVVREEHPALTEISGIAASQANRGRWWVHNDSGDSARFFLISDAGYLVSSVIVDGAAAQDWEDIAVGPPVAASGAATVYLADIGDNASARADIQIYRLVEPAVPLNGDGNEVHATADRLTFTYPDGPHDAETLIVDPDTGDLVIVTKDWSLGGKSNVYRAPAGLAAGSTSVLEKKAELHLSEGTLVTSGDVTPDGSVVALRSYGGVSLYPRAAGQPLWSAFDASPCAGPPPVEKQGEAIGFAADGASYATISEGDHPTLHLTRP